MATARKSVTGVQDVPQLLGGTAIKPIERHGWERVRYFIHNPDTGAFCSRTPKSWFLIFLFYCIYYTCLAGFWYGMLQIFFLSLNDETPKWMQEESIIGTNPGMGVRPRQADARIDSSMYFFNGNWNGEKTTELEQDSDAGFAARMSDFLNSSITNGQEDSVVCSAEDFTRPRNKDEKPCKFEVNDFGPCAAFPYGYGKADIKPCVIVKLNKIFGLIPKVYQPDDELPEEIPQHIKDRIKNTAEPRRVYIECHGENAADIEALQGNIKYYPDTQGVPLGFFPHQSRFNLVSPAIAVQFSNVPKGQLLHIECKAWFKGVIHQRKERMGLVHFELLVNE